MQPADETLVQRIEHADALARAIPESGACSEEIAGGRAIFAGVGSPITQALGVAVGEPISDADMDRMEQFFESRGARVEIECCPFADATFREQLDRRGYRILEWSNVFFQRIASSMTLRKVTGVTVRQARAEEAKQFCKLLLQGFASESDAMGEAAKTLMPTAGALFHGAAGAFFAYVDGQPAGGATLTIHDGVAGLMGASTLPEFRRRGVQSALLQARLQYAAAQGCDLAYSITMPGSGSQRNVERAGFRVVYTRTKVYKSQT